MKTSHGKNVNHQTPEGGVLQVDDEFISGYWAGRLNGLGIRLNIPHEKEMFFWDISEGKGPSPIFNDIFMSFQYSRLFVCI